MDVRIVALPAMADRPGGCATNQSIPLRRPDAIKDDGFNHVRTGPHGRFVAFGHVLRNHRSAADPKRPAVAFDDLNQFRWLQVRSPGFCGKPGLLFPDTATPFAGTVETSQTRLAQLQAGSPALVHNQQSMLVADRAHAGIGSSQHSTL